MRYWAKFSRNFFTVLEKKVKGKTGENLEI